MIIVVVAPKIYVEYINVLSKLTSKLVWLGPNVDRVEEKIKSVEAINVNPLNYSELYKCFKGISLDISIDKIETPYEFYMENLALLRKEFDITGLKPNQCLPLRNKSNMKKRFEEYGINCASHKTVACLDDLNNFIKKYSFPIVIKPLQNAGSRNVFVISELKDALEKADYMFNVLKQNFLAEKFIDIDFEGSFDVVVVNGKIKFGTITEYAPQILKRTKKAGHRIYLRHDLPENIESEIRRLGALVVEALELRNTFAHIEYFYDKQGRVYIGEVGARVPGGHIPKLIGYSQGLKMEEIWAKLIVNQNFEHKINREFHTGIIFIAAEANDVISEITNKQIFTTYKEEIVELNLQKVGDKVIKNRINRNDVEGKIIVKHKSHQEVKRILDDIYHNVKFI